MEQTLPALLKDRYRIEKELGKGSMGVVYLASDQQLLSRPVVVKVLGVGSENDSLGKRKFHQEIEALARIDHPAVVGVIDAGELPDGRPFVVMQYVEGESLRSWMRERVPTKETVEIIKQVAAALTAAHEKGVFHRDLKPENIMLQRFSDGRVTVKLIDFGLAKVLNSQVGESSVVGSVVGSFGYMSPEQLTCKTLTATSDIYSLGVLAYEMLTGARPFDPKSAFELYDFQKTGLQIMPSKAWKRLSPAIDPVIARALSFAPSDRYARAIDFADALEKATHGVASDSTTEAGERTTSALQPLFLLCIVAHITLATLVLKLYFWRFNSWLSFLIGPSTLFLIAFAGVLFFIARRIFLNKELQIHHLIVSYLALLLPALVIADLPPVLKVQILPAINERSTGYTLNYSDPRGYKYTLVDSSFALITIQPGGFNHLNNYRLRLVLSPHLEFSDVYFDQRFSLQDQLSLQPSNTNDVLELKKSGDDFRQVRIIKVHYKYRTPGQQNFLNVSIKSADREFVCEQEIPL